MIDESFAGGQADVVEVDRVDFSEAQPGAPN
jgi:hypothetical protein